MQQSGAAGFRKHLSLWDSTMIVIGSMIGSGIFIVSADIARTVGSPGYLLVVWIVTGVITLTAGLSYGELAGMMPRAGGQYVYLREAYGPFTGFLYGWTLFMVIQTGTIAAVAMAFAKFTAVLVPALGERNILAELGPLRVSAAHCVAIGSILFLSGFHMRGIHGGKLLQDAFTVTKIAALLGLVALGIAAGGGGALGANLSSPWNASWSRVDASGAVTVEALAGTGIAAAIGVAMVGSLFSSDAWFNITFIAGEVKNPRRNIPLSLALGTGIVSLLYICANVSYLAILPLRGSIEAADVLGRGIQFAMDDRVGTAAAQIIFGAPGTAVMAVLIMVSTFGCNNGIILSGARAYYAMARDGLFFRGAEALNSRGVPAWALAIQALWSSILCLSGTYGDLLDYVIFAVLVFYALTVAGIFVLRRTRPEAERPYRALGYPVVPFLYVCAAAAISADLLVLKPKYTWPGLCIVMLGVPVYLIWRRRFHRQPDDAQD
ncbi:MAG: amino acid permease [Spirochaetes bacterium]|nr:amino acid permease [Spirochaetota bacterium]